jgi:hypothetical protein
MSAFWSSLFENSCLRLDDFENYRHQMICWDTQKAARHYWTLAALAPAKRYKMPLTALLLFSSLQHTSREGYSKRPLSSSMFAFLAFSSKTLHACAHVEFGVSSKQLWDLLHGRFLA